MRSAGLPLEALTEYVRLSREGDTTIPERRQLLLEQKERLMIQLKAIQETLERLDYKISRYDKAMETGRLVWD
jgi:DNA-binding transcriptional MerR regulator